MCVDYCTIKTIQRYAFLVDIFTVHNYGTTIATSLSSVIIVHLYNYHP